MTEKALNDFLASVAPYLKLWRSVRASGTAVNVGGTWFNLAVQLEFTKVRRQKRRHVKRIKLIPRTFMDESLLASGSTLRARYTQECSQLMMSIQAVRLVGAAGIRLNAQKKWHRSGTCP